MVLRNITEELEEIDDVEKVTSLANVDDAIGGPDYFEVRAFLEEIPSDPKDLEKIRARATSNPLYVNNFISRDGKTLAILVETYSKPNDSGYRKRLIAKTQSILDKYRSSVDQFHLAGWTTTNLSLSQYLKADLAVFVPITWILVVLVIWVIFRSARLTLLAFANISLCVASTAGLMGLTKVTLNNVTCIVIPLAMALALCDTVHIFSHLDGRFLREYSDKRKALAHVLKKIIAPCFLTTLTTAVGFFSLVVSEIPPIRQFAWIASAAMVFEFIFSFFFMSPLLLFCRTEKVYRESSSNSPVSRFNVYLYDFIRRRHRC